MTRRIRNDAAAALACLVAAAACGGTGGSPSPTSVAPALDATPAPATAAPAPAGPAVDNMSFDAAAPGGTLIIGQGQEPDSLYLYGTGMLASSHIFHSLYDGPIDTLDFDHQPVILEALPKIEDDGPDAVLERVSVAAGGRYVDPETQEVVTATQQVADLPQLTVRFRIVEGVTWQDGTPVTAHDSVFAQALSCDPLTPVSKYVCERTASYTAVDDATVEWKSLPGFTDQTYYSNFYTPLPRHQPGADGQTKMADMDAGAILKDEAFTRKPYAYGAYMVDEWVSGDNVTLVRNPHYWRAPEGLPFLDKVVHRFIPNGDSLIQAAVAGEIDVATTDGLDVSQAEVIDAAVADGKIVSSYLTGTTWEHMNFNLDPVDDRPPLGACLPIRQAVAHATDRQNMVDEVMLGKSRIAHTFVPEEHWAYPPEDMLVAYDYDPEAAKRILDDFGFKDGDGDGIREAEKNITCPIAVGLDGATKDLTIPAGTPLELELMTTEGRPYREQTTLLMQQNLKNVGIDASLQYIASNTFFGDGPDGPVFGRRYDLAEYAFSFGVMPPVSRYYCTDIPSAENAWAGGNHPAWCNPAYDRAAKQAENTLERAAALPLYHQALQLLMQDIPALGLYARVNVRVASPEVVNFKPNPSHPSEAWNIESWGFKTPRP
ncbi:hypothetical protein DCC79_10965 [bacterium]|nr:MAG: hypothetical protein DCC79_10965 [bacterium]